MQKAFFSKSLHFIKSLLIRGSWFFISLFFTLLCIPLALLPASVRFDNRWYFWLTTLWSKLLVRSTFLNIKKIGFENLPVYPHDPSIFTMNHASAVDIFFMEVIPGLYPHVWITKESYLKVPLFNILLKRMHVPIRRESPRKALAGLIKLQKQVAGKARHVLIFPEGTRHSDGKIHDFLIGFALLAKKLKRPVLPIYVAGLHHVFPKKQFIIDNRAVTVTIVIGKPMHIQEDESAEMFKDRVREWYVSQSKKEW